MWPTGTLGAAVIFFVVRVFFFESGDIKFHSLGFLVLVS
jgi:hypothetical protein